MVKKLLLTSTIGATLAFGSATIFQGTKQDIKIESEPSGAIIEIDGQEMGKTPTTLMLRKNEYDLLKLKKEGYETKTVPLVKQYDPTTILSLFWDLSTTDFLTGAAYEYAPNTFMFELEKKEKEEKK